MRTLLRPACRGMAIAALTVFAWTGSTPQRTDAQDAQPAESGSPPVAALVDGNPIYVAEINQAVEQATKSAKLSPNEIELAKAQVLESLIDRRLAALALLQDTSLYSEKQIDEQIKNLEQQTAKQGMTLAEFLKSRGSSLEAVRQEIAYTIAASAYLEKQLADGLESYFNAHKTELDGSQIRARHIMLRPERYNETVDQVIARAAAIREEIESGKLDFSAAASRYSVAPSRERGGDIGFVPRHGVMLEPFAAALFKLKEGEISQPVSTPLGVHLIQAIEIKPGAKAWTQVVPEIKRLAANEEMKKLIEKRRAEAKIEYTGNVPHFKPGTRELVK
jgi:peptidyl-prolyl cis-trans isomerase C